MVETILTCYLASTLLHWGLFFANFQERWPNHRVKWFRRDASASLLLAAIPLCWLIMPFFTGFYELGWSTPWKRPKDG